MLSLGTSLRAHATRRDGRRGEERGEERTFGCSAATRNHHAGGVNFQEEFQEEDCYGGVQGGDGFNFR